jgi:chemotaxis protein histidine kinase CheA
MKNILTFVCISSAQTPVPMEIKYTLEILTKDIQDIEKLVLNLQNTPDGSTLELDLALSKLRNVYDILTVIREDMVRTRDSAGETARKPAPPAREEPRAEKPAPEEAAAAVEETPAEEPAPEEVPAAALESPAVAEEAPATPEEAPAAPEEAPAAEEPSPAKEPARKEAGIVAEKFKAESSINENLAEGRGKDLDSGLLGPPIDSISRNIGINDRFLIIRELFDGDSEAFRKLVDTLDNAGDLKAAKQLLEQHFEGRQDHEGISVLAGLVKRRYNGR